MQLANTLFFLALAILYAGFMCIALSQEVHAQHQCWSSRLNRIGLQTRLARRATGILLSLLAAILMVLTDGWEFGLVLWLMATSALATVLAYLLAK